MKNAIIQKKIPARKTVIQKAIALDLKLGIGITLETPTPAGFFKVKITQNGNYYIQNYSCYVAPDGSLLRQVYDNGYSDSEDVFVDSWNTEWFFIPKFKIIQWENYYTIRLKLSSLTDSVKPCTQGLKDWIRRVNADNQGKSFHYVSKLLKKYTLSPYDYTMPYRKAILNLSVFVYNINEQLLGEMAESFHYEIIHESHSPTTYIHERTD